VTDLERQRLKERVAQWAAAAPVMQALRDEDVRRTNTTEAILQLNDAFESAMLHYGARETSGLVEQAAKPAANRTAPHSEAKALVPRPVMRQSPPSQTFNAILRQP